MDLKGYYRKIHEMESGITDDYPVVKSLPTVGGGRAGRLTEVAKPVAARMLVEGIVELATAEEARDYRLQAEDARKAEEERREAARIQFTILSEADLAGLRRSGRGNRTE